MRRAFPRWAISLADLTMLLLGFFVLQHAAGANVVVRAMRAAFAGSARTAVLLETNADALFEPDEARLKPAARTKLHRIGAAAARAHRKLVVESRGRAPAVVRFDGWELAAARAAALARALSEGGMDERSVTIAMPEVVQPAPTDGQRLAIVIHS
ncbi:MAG: OmpA family protein [Sphingomonadales bacterium]